MAWQADALVVFGATGDLAHQQIFPALYAMARRGRLRVPVIGVGRQPWSDEELRERARKSVADHGDVDQAALEVLTSRLRYVAGDYTDSRTFTALRAALGDCCEHPLFYLAIPPNAFATVASSLDASGCARGARLVVEKPFGRDLASARELDAILHESFPEDAIYRIDHFLGKEPVQNLLYFRFANVFLEPIWCADYVSHVEITMSEAFGIRDRGRFYEDVGAVRDVFQNHLLQILALLAMEPPPNEEQIESKKVELLQAVEPLTPADIVRGQYRGYREQPGVSPDSRVETYVAAHLRINNRRWSGVPFVIRTGKCLAKTFTDVRVRFKAPAAPLFDAQTPGHANAIRFELSPQFTIALRARIKKRGPEMEGEDATLIEHRTPGDEMKPYERLLGDAMRGDHALFGSEAGVEASWRIVDGILNPDQDLEIYKPGGDGPVFHRFPQ
jgi:glucose-6-phosphate 1-dehydrogenase